MATKRRRKQNVVSTVLNDSDYADLLEVQEILLSTGKKNVHSIYGLVKLLITTASRNMLRKQRE